MYNREREHIHYWPCASIHRATNEMVWPNIHSRQRVLGDAIILNAEQARRLVSDKAMEA